MRSPILSFIAYEALWFVVVIGASRGWTWPSLAVAVLFVAWQWWATQERKAALRLVALAIVLGLVVDGGASLSGWVVYATPSPALPPGGAPVWILGLWAAFGVTLVGPFRWIAGRPAWAALLGALGGPLSYLGAARGWDALRFVAPAWQGLAYLAAAWAVALAVLATAAPARRSVSAAPVEGRGQRGNH